MEVSDASEYDGENYKIVNYQSSRDSDTNSDTFHTALVSNGVFTCPLSGTYEFHFMGLSVSFLSYHTFALNKHTLEFPIVVDYGNTGCGVFKRGIQN